MSTNLTKPKPAFLEYAFTMGITVMEGRGFYYPVDTAVGQEGRIYVISRSKDEFTRAIRVTMCTLDGEYFGNFGFFGEENGQFVWPTGVAVDSQGRVYVTDEQLCRVTAYDQSGNYLSHWGAQGTGDGELDTPSGIAFDSQDNLYLSDTYNNRIQKFTTDGRFQASFGAEGDGKLSLPWGLTVDSEENVFVADWGNDRIKKFSSDGIFLTQYGASGSGDGEFLRPSSVAVDNDGYIYVADWGNERVQVLDPQGEFVMKLRGQATISKWAQNYLSVNQEEAEARARADLEKDIEYFVDDPHEESSHMEKFFWSPVSVKLDSAGRLLVTETGRHRIQVYQRSDKQGVAS